MTSVSTVGTVGTVSALSQATASDAAKRRKCARQRTACILLELTVDATRRRGLQLQPPARRRGRPLPPAPYIVSAQGGEGDGNEIPLWSDLTP